MKQVLIVGSKNSGSKNDPIIVARALESDAISTRCVFWEDIVFDIKTGAVRVLVDGEDILERPYDVCIAFGWYKGGKNSYYRDIALSLAEVLAYHSIPFWNSEMALQRSTTKLSAMVQLALRGVPVPITRFSIDPRQSASGMQFPFIAKAISASRGDSNFLVDSQATWQTALEEGVPLLIQNFLENDHDLRVICFNGSPHLILKRSRGAGAHSHMNNTSQGGHAEWLGLEEVPPELLTISEKIVTIMGRELAGIDFIPDASSPFGYSCLEVNAIPQLTSGTEVDIKMAALGCAIKEL